MGSMFDIPRISALFIIVGLSLPTQQPETHFPNVGFSFTEVVQAASTSVLLVETEEASGSGFYVSPPGFVITAKHVVTLSDGSTAKNIRVGSAIAAAKIQGATIQHARLRFKGEVIAQDQDHDLALLKVDGNLSDTRAMLLNGEPAFQPRYPAMLCDRKVTLHSGDSIFTIGHPLGDLRQITTRGIIASA
jgi:S1-C subfamily serine protease